MISGKKIKMKVKKSKEDKKVSLSKMLSVIIIFEQFLNIRLFWLQRDKNRAELLEFLNSTL